MNNSPDIKDETVKLDSSKEEKVMVPQAEPQSEEQQISNVDLKSNKYGRIFLDVTEYNNYEKQREDCKKTFALMGKRISAEEFEQIIPEWIRRHELRMQAIDYDCKYDISLYKNLTFDFPPIQLSDNLFYFGQWGFTCTQHGEGILFNSKSGTLLQGLFDNNNIIYGRIIKSDESVYEGETNKFNPDGLGKKTLKNKDIYEGTWSNGKLIGEVVIKYKDGSIFSGYLNDDKEIDGMGKMFWLDGSSYEGCFVKNYIEGQGVIKTHLFRYEGAFLKSKFDGEGKSEWTEKKTKFVGEYLNGMKKSGTFYYPGGQQFKGSFKNNLPEGYGQLILTDGLVLDGEYSKGILIKNESNAKQHNISYDELLVNISKEPADFLSHIKYDFKDYSSLVHGLKKNKGGLFNSLLK